MPLISIEQTSTSPLVQFDEENLTLKIVGESYPENSFEFYAPVNAWLKNALAAYPSIRLDINVSYMNSSSTKCMLDILDILEEAHASGGKVSVVWRYDQENPRSLDLAEEFQEEVTCEFQVVPLEE